MNPTLTTSELLVILDITRRLTEQRLVQPLMAYVASTVFELVHAERCMIVTFADDGTPDVQVARDRQGNNLGNVADQMSRSILDRVRQSITPLRVNDAMSEKSFMAARSVRKLNLRSVMCIPLISYGQAIGAIYVENRSASGQFREENLIPLILLSNQVVVALENARLYESLEARISERTETLTKLNGQLAQQAVELREQSIRDSLTGLHNRRYFNEIVPHLFELTRRYGRPLSIACLDIDHFKRINDTYFHAGGDIVLAAIARALCEHIRSSDIIARVGGEEFILMMPETPLSAAVAVCERLRLAVAACDLDSVAPGLRVTISIGCADDTGCANEQELLRQADSRLYLAKGQGRNRVVATDSMA